MLGKLLKYEFRSTARYFLPIYAAMIVVTVLNAWTSRMQTESELLPILLLSMYITVIIGLSVVTIIVIISQFFPAKK